MKSNKIVILIDDFAPDRELYYRYLQQENRCAYTIIEAESGEEALDKCQSSQPDLILLDYQLPDLDGLEFITELKTQNKMIPPILMLTGQGDEQIAVKAMKSGVKDYLVKGNLTEEMLRNSVYSILQQQYFQNLLIKSRQQQQLISEISLRIRQSLELSAILNSLVKEVQILLDCDRVVIYRFNAEMIGEIVAESVKSDWKNSLGLQIVDTCFQNQGTAKYQQGYPAVINNVYEANLSPCHLKLLEEFQVKANLVVPISPTSTVGKSNRLWGLLIAHQCSSRRVWQTDEIELLNKLAVQLAIAIQQAELLENLQSELTQRKQAEKVLKEKTQELEWANQQLIKTTQLLKKRNQELDEFAYIASHDLKAPLRAIANLAHWLQEDLGEQISEENQHHLDLLQSRVKRMEGFIQSLLTYSRIGRTAISKEQINVADLLHETINFLSVPPTFIIEIASNMPTFTTDKLSLHQVFANLIGNAIKYHYHSDGKISILVREKGTFYEFAVQDDGPGIAPEYHQKIFGIFQTLHSRDNSEGSGVGLSIVKKIVENQGGTIKLESQVEEGTTFYFTWKK